MVSRRALFKSVAAVPLAGITSTARGFDRGLPRLPRTGSGEFTYEAVHDWLVPPANIQWGETQGLAVDSQSRIYVAHTVHRSSVVTDAVLVFDPKGKFIKSWGSEFKGGAHGLDVRKEGSEEFLYHCDTRRRLLVKTDLDGHVVWQRNTPAEPEVYRTNEQWCPTNVAFGPEDEVYVGDGYGASYIHKFDRFGNYLGLLAGPGKEPGQVSCPHGLWLDTRDGDPKIAVCDRSNSRLQYFSLEGKHLGFVTEGVRSPCHVKFKGDFGLIPDLNGVVTILNKANQVAARLGVAQCSSRCLGPGAPICPGEFLHPHAAIWLGMRDILVSEWVPMGRVTLLRGLE